ncbi:hypothetical protein AWJ20_1817 [Sugiyamaella lignohabitans]|uniref:DUF1014-domain-containing protein n=1 Tax=Sugiyamaella lignohabitans TaxID=796027 RepID=A0A167E115_9ASCO|nr:uncharacterized protein AWJ20_1817 [Sugiyamaella lignohabitans]ANB13522.1 hypothetical protein AWJ20_1817 [Sugiyamaella lignohabitans]
MGKTRGGSENSKKAQGNSRKAEAADRKRAEEEARLAAAEDAEWSVGAKGSNNKKESEAAKKAEAARKKAERDAMLKEEEDALPSKSVKSKQRGQEKVAARRQGNLDEFLNSTSNKASTLSASGIDDAIDALEISTGSGSNKKIERHPERRFKAAFAAYEERRLPEIKDEHPGLRLNQYKELIRKEFEKSDENPFNQATVSYNATQEDVHSKKQALKKAAESRLEER